MIGSVRQRSRATPTAARAAVFLLALTAGACGRAGFDPQTADAGLPDGGVLLCSDQQSCQYDCRSGDCTVDCTGETCSATCRGGGCGMTCHTGTCTFSCRGGGCDVRCEPEVDTCRVTCNGGDCDIDCAAASCEIDCTGGGCTGASAPVRDPEMGLRIPETSRPPAGRAGLQPPGIARSREVARVVDWPRPHATCRAPIE